MSKIFPSGRLVRVFLLLAMVAWSANQRPVQAQVLSDELPKLQGETFGVELRTGAAVAAKSMVVLWNIDQDRHSLYTFDPGTRELRPLYVLKARVQRRGSSWVITTAKGAFRVERSTAGDLSFDGRPSALRHLPEGELVALSVVENTAESGGDVAGDSGAFAPKVSTVCWAFTCSPASQFSSCCGCCFCTHRILGIPEIADGLCCGFGCL